MLSVCSSVLFLVIWETNISYSKGGPLAVTDANLLLGRLIPDYFPKIFGKSEKEPLDAEASESAFKKVVDEINASHDKTLSLDEIVYGLVVPLAYVVSLISIFLTIQVYQSSQRDHVPSHPCAD